METERIECVENPVENVKAKLSTDMTSSMISATSSLTSPVDSGVQLLDSESDLASVMSASGLGCDLDTIGNLEKDFVSTQQASNVMTKSADCEKLDELFNDLISTKDEPFTSKWEGSSFSRQVSDKAHVMTKSDIANQNTTHYEHYDPGIFSTSAPNSEFLQTHAILNEIDSLSLTSTDSPKHKSEDVMNISLNSYELLDYTMANTKTALSALVDDQMHVSLSEEVNESLLLLKTAEQPSISPLPEQIPEIIPEMQIIQPPDEQIVFRRQRKKKSKSGTPKKRVSFHEDILNSTKIDDVHINHGFVTMESDVSYSFFQKGFSKKPDVVQGRYSWAAEGDAPYYDPNKNDRETKSDLYVHSLKYSSTSSGSSSGGSSGSVTSSIDEEDEDDEEVFLKKEPSMKAPKSSCLKKTKHKTHIDTKIVEEDTGLRKKKAESNLLLDSNLFGSLKNILNFSTSVPLAERGVPEGQEDFTMYSSSHDATCLNTVRSRPPSANFEVNNEEVHVKMRDTSILRGKGNLRLSISEGFYPNYPNNGEMPDNIILCDSNVYEHTGISYSYEYDNFKRTFETEKEKPKGSTVYQKILKEFNFFRRKAKMPSPPIQPAEMEDEFEILNHSSPVKLEPAKNEEISVASTTTTAAKNSTVTVNKFKMDWSDNETTISESLPDSGTSRHLNSPKKKISKANHYALPNIKIDSDTESQCSKSLSNMHRGSSASKNSLINRFLRNVTVKKMLDMKWQKKHRKHCGRRFSNLYIKGAEPDLELSRDLDREIEKEISAHAGNKSCFGNCFDPKFVGKLKKEIFRDQNEDLIKVFGVSSAYTTSGTHQSLMAILSNTTIYITDFRPQQQRPRYHFHLTNRSYTNHFVLPYTELDVILIGPNLQSIHLSNLEGDMQCLVTTGCGEVTHDLIVQLEMAMRTRDPCRPRLPAVRMLTMHELRNLRKAVCKQTTVDKKEEYLYYSIVNLQEYNTGDNGDNPLGPNREGPLMFKISDSSEARWETAYFILKAGVLYMLSSSSHKVPLKVLPLLNGACEGAQRLPAYPRPHTFQLTVAGIVLQLAAPDEYAASDWLQALLQSASGCYNNQRERRTSQACTLLMTEHHVLAVREVLPCHQSYSRGNWEHDPGQGAKALSCAAIADITAFRLPVAEQSWCILEFACREVHETSGDWILYFATNRELDNFISTLEMLWTYHNEGESFPITTVSESEPLNKRCVETYKHLQSSWLLI